MLQKWLNHSLPVAECLFYRNKIEQAKSKIKSTWRLLNKLLNMKSSKQNLPSVFKYGKQELSDPEQIAEQFCKDFTNIDSSLSNNIPVSQKSYHSFLSGNFVNSLFFFFPDLCSSLHSGTASGFDGLMSVIRDTIIFISSPLTHILHVSNTLSQ